MTRKLLPDCYLRVIAEEADENEERKEANRRNTDLAEGSSFENGPIYFPSMPKGLNFQRTAEYKQTGAPVWTEPLMQFSGNTPLELNLELDYVAGIHLGSVEELYGYAKRWQALPILSFADDAREQNSLRAPNAVWLKVSKLISTRGLIKNVSVSFSEDYTWENPEQEATGSTAVNPMPIAFRVNFTFLESYLYAGNKNLAGISNDKAKLGMQKTRKNVLKNFYNYSD